MSRAARRIFARVAIGIAIFAAFGANAADHRIAGTTPSFNCSSVAAGDTITLASGERGPLVVRDCKGTAAQPVRVRNDSSGSGPVTIRRNSGNAGGFVFNCQNCVYVEIDGSNKWAGAPGGDTYGIKVTMTGGGSPTAFVNVSGLSRFVTIRNVEIDGAWPALATDGIGIAVNDHSVLSASNPGVWREGILIDHNYVHDVEGEGLYVGPNWRDGADLPLRDIEIRNNRIEDTGWDGINLKSAIAGTNKVHHNVVKRSGSRPDGADGQHHGITVFEGGASVYNNWVEGAGQVGIQHFLMYLPTSYGPQACEIFNNVVLNSGRTRPKAGHGIVSGNRDGAAVATAKIYNNTVIGGKAAGIRVGVRASGGSVWDNIVAGPPTPIDVPRQVVTQNNRTGAVSVMGFMDEGADFRLREDSPARNAGSSAHPATDYLDVPRPQDGTADQGAYEFSNSSPATKPKPPVLAVE